MSGEEVRVRRRRHPGAGRGRGALVPKGRQVQPEAQDEIRVLLGDRPRRRDLLIEYLHLVQDRYGQLSAAHLAALAEEMRVPMSEIYETATFYAHFDVVGEDAPPPPTLTVRVCDSLTCELMGAGALIRELEAHAGSECRVVRAPCMGRCHCAPTAEVGHRHVDHASAGAVFAAIDAGETHPVIPPYRAFDAYCEEDGGYALCAPASRTNARSRDVVDIVSRSGLRGFGGAGIPHRAQVVDRARVSGSAPHGGECGRGGGRDLQGPPLPRAGSASLPGRHARGGVGGGGRARVHLPARRVSAVREILLTEILKIEAAGFASGVEIELRRGAGAYICGEESSMIEVDRGQARTAPPPPPYVAEVGLFGCPTLVQNVETLYWCATSSRRVPNGSRAMDAAAARGFAASRFPGGSRSRE